MKEATELYVRPYKVDCPYCGYELDNFLIDPRGYELDCDNCEKTFVVPEEVPLIMY